MRHRFHSILPRIVLSFLTVTVAAQATATELLTNGDFETNDFTGWTGGITPSYAQGGRPNFYDPFGDGWITSNATQMFGVNTINPINNHSAFNGFDGGVVDEFGASLPEADLQFYLRQSVVVAGPYASATLTYKFDIDGGPVTGIHGLQNIESRVFTTSITDLTNATTLASVVSPAGPANLLFRTDIPRQTVTLDITSILNGLPAGTYFLQFDELIPQASTGVATFVLDDVSLDVVAVPEPSSWLLTIFAACGAWIIPRRARLNSKPAA